MKTTHSVKAIKVAITTICLLVLIFSSAILKVSQKQYISENKTELENNLIEPKVEITNTDTKKITVEKTVKLIIAEGTSREKQKQEALEKRKNEVVYEGMTLNELSEKLDRSLNSTLQNHGLAFADAATRYGVDPYLAVAIVLHETGCKWQCSTLLTQCNNVGGLKYGSNTTCSGTSYASFSSLDEGIESYIKVLYENYVAKGLTTPEAIGPRYAGSDTWASQVNSYINELKAA